MKYVNKAINRILKVFKDYGINLHFSFYYAHICLMCFISSYINRSKHNVYLKKKDNYIIQYLRREYQSIFEHIIFNEGTYDVSSPIWVCWWTGIETAPRLVQQCVKSIQKNANGHDVIIITQDNYLDYLEVPQYILDKVNSKQLCLANFSDYLRVSLLYKYGGLWLDATIYVSQLIPKEYFKLPIYTCNSPYYEGYMSHGRWTSFCLGGYKHNSFFLIAKECFEKHWEKNYTSIDYLLVDYTFNAIYESNQQYKLLFDRIPLNNLNRNQLSAGMHSNNDSSSFMNYISDDTIFYKLSWREKFPSSTSKGEDSIYKYFLEMKI